MYDMMVKPNELSSWISTNPQAASDLLAGYNAAISNMLSDLLTDPRSSINTHILNNDFVKQPKYFLGFTKQDATPEFVLSCLYVFPDHRHKGYAKRLIDTAKQLVQDKGFIHAAVESSKVATLDKFYKQQDFQTTGDVIAAGPGLQYCDYFWSGKQIQLERVGDTIAVKPL